ncbi:MAG: hypothetical protein DUW69_001682 [Verrucomicrobia bacterium]|jgi:hypothetical protein|nr:MAG: hypothetical protein DUW69_001682 [Verrucomicrobiota bacterium]
MKPPAHRFIPEVARARYEAWWRCARVDRPPVSLWVKTPHPLRAPRSTHATLRERWLDVEYQVDCALTGLETNPILGDTAPSYLPNVGPDLTSTLFGAELVFGENTSWCQHTVPETADWERFIATPPDFDNVYWRTIDAMITRAAERFEGRYYVAMPDLHGSFDILAGVRGPENVCLDLMDEPELVRRASLHASHAYVEAYRRLYQRLTALGQPSTTWCSYLHTGPAYIPSCDFWCLVSKEIAQEYVRPTIELEMAPLERSIFHLDGPQALHHLDLMLSLPGLNAVQWVFGSGHGPAAKWIDVYRRCLAAGKALQILADDPADALTVLRELGPDGLWLTICTPFANTDEATDFLDTVHRLSP